MLDVFFEKNAIDLAKDAVAMELVPQRLRGDDAVRAAGRRYRLQ